MSLYVDAIVKLYAYDIMFMLVHGCGGSVVHVDVKECGGQNRALGTPLGFFLGEMTCHNMTRV